jgi:hypothetical protein
MLWKSLSFAATALAISLNLAAAPAKAEDGDVTRDNQAKSSYELHHRVLLPLPGRESTSKFCRRGAIDISTSNTALPEGIVPSVSITEQGSSPLPLPTAEDEVDWNRVFEKSWYQLALELPDVDEDLWPKSVVKLVSHSNRFVQHKLTFLNVQCHLFTSSPVSDVLTVYIPAVSDVNDVIPESIFYSVASAPTNGGCPRGKKVDVRSRRDLEVLLSGLQSTWNTSVKVASTEKVVL